MGVCSIMTVGIMYFFIKHSIWRLYNMIKESDTTFKLSVDNEGNPLIEFKHYHKSDSLYQRLLGVLIKKSREGVGIELVPTGGSTVNNVSYDNYEIKLKQQGDENTD